MRGFWWILVRWLPILLCAAVCVGAWRCAPQAAKQTVSDCSAAAFAYFRGETADAAFGQTHQAKETETLPTVPPSVPKKAVSAVTAPIIPPKGDGGGAVVEEQVGGGTQAAEGIYVKNNCGVSFDYASLLQQGLPMTVADTSDPQVLIVHTHATECYMSYYAGYYNGDDPTRTTEPTESVIAVGEAIAQELRARGIGVIHDTTLHDSPQYSGAYSRCEDTIRSYLQQYPSVCVVLDIHRDAIMYDDLTKVKPTVSVGDQKAAQVMLVVGGTDTADLPNDYCEENLRFGLQLQQALETTCPGLARPLYLVDARYNQGLLPGSLLIEVGTDANMLSEALYSGHLVGRQLAELLL